MDIQEFRKFCEDELKESVIDAHLADDQERLQAANDAINDLTTTLNVLAIYEATKRHA